MKWTDAENKFLLENLDKDPWYLHKFLERSLDSIRNRILIFKKGKPKNFGVIPYKKREPRPATEIFQFEIE